MLPVVVVGVTFLALLPVLDAGFLNRDDGVNLLESPHYRGVGRSSSGGCSRRCCGV